MTLSTTSPPVALLGEAPPRVHVAPPRSPANSWQDVADLSARFGVVLDEWQELVLQAAMGERRDRTWAAQRVGLSVPRQNGKSQLLVARVLAGALLFGERKIVVSAHQQDTSRESFDKLLEIIEADGNEALRARLKPNGVMRALNREVVRFTNGSVIQFKARSGPGGRGFSSDCLMLDEAQILPERAWVSINSTMSAMPNPQVWLMGTPPTPEDDGVVFGNVRASAMAGKSTATAWLEWSADPEDDPASELTRWSANPAWNRRINHEVVDGEAETYPPDRFALDRLGIWPVDQVAAQVIPPLVWSERLATVAPAQGQAPDALAIDVFGRTKALSAGWRLEGGGVYVKLLEVDISPGTSGFVAAVADAAGRRIPVLLAADAPAASLLPNLRALRVNAAPVNAPDYGKACVGFVADVAAGSVTHAGQDQLNLAVAGAKKRNIGVAGSWGWDRKSPTNDVAPLVAATLARFGALTHQSKPAHVYAF